MVAASGPEAQSLGQSWRRFKFGTLIWRGAQAQEIYRVDRAVVASGPFWLVISFDEEYLSHCTGNVGGLKTLGT